MLGIDSDNPTLPRRRDDAHFTAKLVVFMHFALGDALHLRGMNTIDLAVIRALLRKDPPRDYSLTCVCFADSFSFPRSTLRSTRPK